ncbi:MAG: histidine phosphatase family protein [Deltaproteobacteria bacterium]|jgi:2,3-bisphosphoglycerate-dependent phosphoglycerate mutase|nr:histidine phosphatase family protein [Deltaproteobacteria bacterium]MBT4639741.1 histidine phosphatase family protein [Deltaproteobacteria bacterium]
MELIIIRHGLPLTVEKEDGTAADPELSPEGVQQAAKMADWMQSEKLDVLYCSPMKRALMTAEPLAKIKNLEMQIEPGVAEIDQHSSSYVPMEEIKEKHPEQWQQIIEDGVDKTFNAIGNVELFREKVVKTIETIIDANKGKRVAVVCHGGIINVWAAHILGIKNPLFFAPDYTSINRFMASSSGVHSLKSLNEAGHLR